MNKIKAVIFDMDGVLIDAKEWHYEALNRALGLFGMEISRYDHLVTFDGLPTRKKLEMLSKEKNLPVGLHGFINELKQQYTLEIIFQNCKPIFYHQYALSKLASEGYKIAVCSNSIKKTMELMLEKSALNKYLDFFLSNQDVVKSKPDPEMYNTAIKRLNLKADECLVVEDNEHGIKAATDSGAYVMKIKNIDEVNYQNIMEKIKHIESK